MKKGTWKIVHLLLLSLIPHQRLTRQLRFSHFSQLLMIVYFSATILI